MLSIAATHGRAFAARTRRAIGIAATAALAAGCGTTSMLVPTAQTQAAIGQIRAHVDGNNNTVLRVSAEHLVQPTRLASNLTAYVVWIRPATGGDFVRAGRLVPDPTGSASFSTSTPWRDVELIVTAEQTPAVTRPAETVVLRGYASPRQ